jgi:hypothetical protein
MTEVPSTQASGVPSAAEFTASPLGNRLVLELEAPLSQVWALLGDLALARHPRQQADVWIEPVAKQLDTATAIGDLYRFDRFAAPARVWDELQERFPELLTAA